MISAEVLGWTVILKAPSALVTVPPALEPFAKTDAPTTGDPSFESVTLPVITLSWPKETKDILMAMNSMKHACSSRLRVINNY